MTAHTLDPTILREYDIRGIVGETLSEADARAIGRAFASLVAQRLGVDQPRLVTGRDGRESSPSLSAAVIEGMVQAGAVVTDVGLGPTPMVYFATKHFDADGGLMLTGSHNPPNYNGFKMLTRSGPFFGSDIQALGHLAAAGTWHEPPEAGGARVDPDLFERYVARLAEDVSPGVERLRVAWDCGNGATGPATQALVSRMPGQHTVLFADVDGTFPNHHPDPTEPKNLSALRQAVNEGGCDLGIAFDGDGDRIGVIDSEGEILWGDQLLALYAREVLADRPGATIIADVKASKITFDEIARLGGTPLMWKTGHSLIKAKMAETGAPLAGEMSGHVFFADRYYGFDDALYAAVRLLSLVVSDVVGRHTLASLRQGLPRLVSTPETRFEVAETEKFPAMERISANVAQLTDVDVATVDGVRVTTPDGWWLLRASNTQNVLVARAEAADAEALERLKTMIREQLDRAGVAAPEGF